MAFRLPHDRSGLSPVPHFESNNNKDFVLQVKVRSSKPGGRSHRTGKARRFCEGFKLLTVSRVIRRYSKISSSKTSIIGYCDGASARFAVELNLTERIVISYIKMKGMMKNEQHTYHKQGNRDNKESDN